MSWRRSWAIARHEFLIMATDKAALVSLVMMPVVMMGFLKPLSKLALVRDHPGANGSEYSVPAMAVLFAFFLIGYVGFLFFSEHRQNTWERLLASQARHGEIMLGKLIPVLGLFLLQQGVLFAAGAVLFGLRVRGSVAGLVLVILALSLCLTAAGVLLAAVLKTEQQLNVASNFGAMALGGVSGALVPISVLPAWSRHIAPIAPHYWALRGMRAVILDGGGLSTTLLPAAILFGLAAVFTVLSLLRFRFDEPKVVAQ